MGLKVENLAKTGWRVAGKSEKLPAKKKTPDPPAGGSSDTVETTDDSSDTDDDSSVTSRALSGSDPDSALAKAHRRTAEQEAKRQKINEAQAELAAFHKSRGVVELGDPEEPYDFRPVDSDVREYRPGKPENETILDYLHRFSWSGSGPNVTDQGEPFDASASGLRFIGSGQQPRKAHGKIDDGKRPKDKHGRREPPEERSGAWRKVEIEKGLENIRQKFQAKKDESNVLDDQITASRSRLDKMDQIIKEADSSGPQVFSRDVDGNLVGHNKGTKISLRSYAKLDPESADIVDAYKRETAPDIQGIERPITRYKALMLDSFVRDYNELLSELRDKEAIKGRVDSRVSDLSNAHKQIAGMGKKAKIDLNFRPLTEREKSE